MRNPIRLLLLSIVIAVASCTGAAPAFAEAGDLVSVPSAPAPTPPATAAPADALHEEEKTTLEEHVEAWFRTHFHNLGPMLDTPIYNLLHRAKDELKALLAEHFPDL